jgi:hypothetical protein
MDIKNRIKIASVNRRVFEKRNAKQPVTNHVYPKISERYVAHTSNRITVSFLPAIHDNRFRLLADLEQI